MKKSIILKDDNELFKKYVQYNGECAATLKSYSFSQSRYKETKTLEINLKVKVYILLINKECIHFQ